MANVYSPIWESNNHEPLAHALGDVILAWTQAEFNQVSLLAAILNLPHATASRIYQKFPNFRSRTQVLFTLIELHPEFEVLAPFIAKFSSLSKTRNNYIHGSFIQSWEKTDLRVIDLNEPSSSDKRSKPTKPNDILQHARAVRKNCEDFRLAGEKCPAYKAWLGPHPTQG